MVRRTPVRPCADFEILERAVPPETRRQNEDAPARHLGLPTEPATPYQAQPAVYASDWDLPVYAPAP